MSDSKIPVTEDELHAYIDNELPAERRGDVEAWLATHPDDAERVQSWRSMAEMLHARYDAVANEPVPKRLELDRLAREPRKWIYGTIAAALVAFVAGGGAGWLAHDVAASPSVFQNFTVDALDAYRLYVVEVRHPVEVPGDERAHLQAWLTKRCGWTVRAPELGATGLKLVGGRLLPADLVLIGIGLEPRTELAEQLGLEVDNGIVVDEYARTSNLAIVAAGDCTTLPHPLTGEGRMRIESVQNAIAQAQTAAASLLGHRSATRAVPWFWSDQADLKLQIAGLSHGYDQVVVRGAPPSERFSVLYYASDKLIAVDAINTPRDYMVARKVLGEGGTIPAGRAADASVPLKELVTAATGS